MQAIIEIKTDTTIDTLETVEVPQYPFTFSGMKKEIEDNKIYSASRVLRVAFDCEDTVSKQRVLFAEEVDKLFPDYYETTKEGVNLSALCIAENADFGILRGIVSEPDKAYKALKDNEELYKLADGYNAFMSAFTHYHAGRIGGEYKELHKLLLGDKISPINQPLFLSDDYSRVYILADDYLSIGYERETPTIVNITDCVYKLLRSLNIIESDKDSLKCWLVSGAVLPAEKLGQALAFALFEYKTDDCFVISVV